MARAFVAKAVYDMLTTHVLLDRLDTDVALWRIYGWEKKSVVPSESVSSLAFAEPASERCSLTLPAKTCQTCQRCTKPLASSIRPRVRQHGRLG